MTTERDERGVALLLALVTAALITSIATTIVMSTTTDLLITGSHRAAVEVMYAAEAAAQRSLGELAALPDWSPALTSPPLIRAAWDDGLTSVRAPDGRVLGMGVLGAARQAASNITCGPGAFGADAPVWRLFGHGRFESIVPSGLIVAPAYVLVWVADDPDDGDGDPSLDANGRILLHAEAYGVSGAHRAIEFLVERVTPGSIRVLSWKDPR